MAAATGLWEPSVSRENREEGGGELGSLGSVFGRVLGATFTTLFEGKITRGEGGHFYCKL